jgi:hypothetical protein
MDKPRSLNTIESRKAAHQLGKEGARHTRRNLAVGALLGIGAMTAYNAIDPTMPDGKNRDGIVLDSEGLDVAERCFNDLEQTKGVDFGSLSQSEKKVVAEDCAERVTLYPDSVSSDIQQRMQDLNDSQP